MILFIRKYFHQRLMQGFALVAILSVVGIGSLSQMINLFYANSNSAFSVNGHHIGKQLFALRTATEKRVIDFYRTQLGELAPRFLAQAGLEMSPEKNAYNKIVQEIALSDCAKNSGLAVHARTLAQRAQDPMTLMNIFGSSMPRALYDRNGKIQQDILVRLLASVGLTLSDFENLLEESTLRDLTLDLVRIAVPVSQKELDAYALKEYGKRHFALTIYSIAPYLARAAEQPVSQEELQRFFVDRNAQNKTYWSKEKRSGTLWKIAATEKNKLSDLTQSAAAAVKDDAAFNAFLLQHKAHKTPVVEVTNSAKYSMLFQLGLHEHGYYEDAGSLVLVTPTSIEPAVERSFDAVHKKVLEDYQLAQAQKAMIEDLEAAGIADEHKMATQSFTLDGENKEAEIEKLTKKSFAGDRINNMVIAGSKMRGLQDRNGYLVTLERVEQPQLTSEQYRHARSAVLKDAERILTAASVDSLIKNAKIKNNKL